MATLTLPANLRRWAAFGSGAGLVLGDQHIDAAVVRLRPGGPRLVGVRRIENYRQRPAAEWGREYSDFLAKTGSGHLAAVALLTRQSVILRQIALPGVRDEDAPAAIRFQLDSLHPYAEDDIYFDFQRLGSSPNFAVLIVERALLDQHLAHLAEAGIKLAAISVSASVFHRALRLYGEPAPGWIGFVDGETPEFYGESLARPLFTAALDVPTERIAAELRLEPEHAEPRPLAALLPAAGGAPPLAYAAALAAAGRHMGEPLNLLPRELRVSSSRVRYIPTAALALLLACSAGAYAVQNKWQDREYAGLLEAEIHKLQSQASQVDALDRQIAARTARLHQLSEFRSRSQADLDLLLELTRILTAPAWANALEINRGGIQIAGEAEHAEELLKRFDSSPLLHKSEFSMPLARTQSGEAFRIRSEREAGRR